MVQDHLMMEIDNGSNDDKASIGGGILLGDGVLIDGKILDAWRVN